MQRLTGIGTILVDMDVVGTVVVDANVVDEDRDVATSTQT
jgi:hypothetical protein